MAVYMDLIGFEHKSLITTPNNLTYSYYLSPDFHSKLKSTPSTPILLLLHGFPDDAHMWAGVVPSFLQLNYPCILPDLLGFSGSSKPTNPNLYNYRQQANSLAQILDFEGVPKRVIPIGHDWGSATAQRFFLYHRERCTGLCIISLAYQIPSPKPFSLWNENHETAKKFGYPQWAYWNFCKSYPTLPLPVFQADQTSTTKPPPAAQHHLHQHF
jgi:soluble epoxide hydrolase / lipid-phosphate phosphatase